MSRTIASRLATTGLLTLATGLTGLVLIPSASAAEAAEVTLSATSVAPGEEFTISGTDCVSEEDGYEPLVGVMSENGDIEEYFEPAVDGSWSVTTAFPEDMAAGEQLMVAFCDSSYNGGSAYAEWTMTVEGGEVGAIRGVEANTPGTKAVTSDKTTTSATPGQKVVRIIEGFQPHEVVTLVMHSTPVVLGTFTADANGVLTAEFTLPAGAAAGTHTLVYEGTVTYFQESFTVAAAGAQLASTGADVTVPLTLGLGLVAAGAGALFVSRRRTSGAPQA